MAGSGQLTKIKNKILCRPSELEPGMIALIDYTNRRAETKQHMYLVLDVNPQLSRTVHCLDLDKVSQEQLYKLLEFTLKKRPLLREFKQEEIHVLRFTKVPKQNYIYNIKPRLKTTIPGAYKMLKYERINNVFVVEYKWKEVLVDKYVD